MSTSIELDADGQISLSGVLDFQTVPALAKRAKTLLDKKDATVVDCSQVVSSNSAGLALLLEMSRIMRATEQSIRFQNVPQQIQTVARAYGLIEPEQALEAIL